MTVQVSPFPKSHQPASFTGALGKIKIDAHLETSSTMLLGDNLQLQVKVEGVTNLADLRFPSLQCQPGFSGFFQTSDLPPLAEVKDNVKIFHVELRPLTSLIKEIPPIEVSSFDPATNEYIVQKTSSFPLTVHAPAMEREKLKPPLPMMAPLASIGQWPTPLSAHFEMEDTLMKKQSGKRSTTDTLRILWLLPLGFALLLLQKYWKDQWKKRPKPRFSKSEELFRQALKSNFQSMKDVQLLELAFWNRLWEKGFIAYRTFRIEQLSQMKELVPVQSFLLQLQALQYSSDRDFNPLLLKEEGKRLFVKI